MMYYDTEDDYLDAMEKLSRDIEHEAQLADDKYEEKRQEEIDSMYYRHKI